MQCHASISSCESNCGGDTSEWKIECELEYHERWWCLALSRRVFNKRNYFFAFVWRYSDLRTTELFRDHWTHEWNLIHSRHSCIQRIYKYSDPKLRAVKRCFGLSLRLHYLRCAHYRLNYSVNWQVGCQFHGTIKRRWATNYKL